MQLESTMAEDAAREAEMEGDASKLIRAYEVAGGVETDKAIEAGFNRVGKKPSVPSNSGLTLGFGHDIGQSSAAEIDRVYGPQADGTPEILTSAQRDTLKKYAGQTHFTAAQKKAALKATKGIVLTYEQGTQVFEKTLLQTKGIQPARDAFPGFDDLPPQTQAAVVDRVFMRGSHPNPTEHALGKKYYFELKDAIFKKDTRAVYAALVHMERLHKNSKKSSSTQGRARARAALAKEGYVAQLNSIYNGTPMP